MLQYGSEGHLKGLPPAPPGAHVELHPLCVASATPGLRSASSLVDMEHVWMYLSSSFSSPVFPFLAGCFPPPSGKAHWCTWAGFLTPPSFSSLGSSFSPFNVTLLNILSKSPCIQELLVPAAPQCWGRCQHCLFKRCLPPNKQRLTPGAGNTKGNVQINSQANVLFLMGSTWLRC